jgi:hypothetical protein
VANVVHRHGSPLPDLQPQRHTRTDMAIVHKTINHWSGIYGERYESVMVPISWGSHAAAEFGRGPQAILNEQLVDSCDMCIAIFWDRLGTPTALNESGSAEEIQRRSERGKYVAILRCTRDIRPDIDIGQLDRLKKYLEKIEKNALISNYGDHAELATQVDNIIVRGVNLDLAGPTGARYANVWPRIDKGKGITARVYI